MTLPRGFKAEAERSAARVRSEMGLARTSRLDVRELATHVGIKLVSAEQLVDRGRIEELERLQAFAFSAATFEIRGSVIIVSNPLRTPGRIASDVAHEISHHLLKHDLTEIREVNGTAFRTCKPDEEEQATAYGGTLLLPRPALLAAVAKGDTEEDIAIEFGVTSEMARFRVNTTGVTKQVRRRSG